MIIFAPAFIFKSCDQRCGAVQKQKLFVTPLASTRESGMRLVWGRQRDDPESNMGYRPAKMNPVTADRSGSGGTAGGRKG
jgi:hypothetical protein